MATMSEWEKSEEQQAKTEDNASFYEKLSDSREQEFPMLLGGSCAKFSSVKQVTDSVGQVLHIWIMPVQRYIPDLSSKNFLKK